MASSGATSFNGSSSYIDGTSTSAFNITTGDITVLCWAKSSDFTPAANNSFFGNRTASGGWSLGMNTTGNLHFVKQGVVGVASSLSYTDNLWNGCAAIVDNGTDVDFVHILGSTHVVSTDLGVSAANNIAASSGDLEIGRFDTGSPVYTSVSLAYIQIFNRLLSVNEATNALFCPGSVRNGLIFYAPLNGINQNDLSATGDGLTENNTPGDLNDSPPVIIKGGPQ